MSGSCDSSWYQNLAMRPGFFCHYLCVNPNATLPFEMPCKYKIYNSTEFYWSRIAIETFEILRSAHQTLLIDKKIYINRINKEYLKFGWYFISRSRFDFNFLIYISWQPGWLKFSSSEMESTWQCQANSSENRRCLAFKP